MIIDSEGGRVKPYIISKLSGPAIPHLVDGTPFEQMFYLVEALPKLWALSIRGLKEITMPHVFSSQQFNPQTIILVVYFPNPFHHEALI
jgi:hypothetical protein